MSDDPIIIHEKLKREKEQLKQEKEQLKREKEQLKREKEQLEMECAMRSTPKSIYEAFSKRAASTRITSILDMFDNEVDYEAINMIYSLGEEEIKILSDSVGWTNYSDKEIISNFTLFKKKSRAQTLIGEFNYGVKGAAMYFYGVLRIISFKEGKWIEIVWNFPTIYKYDSIIKNGGFYFERKEVDMSHDYEFNKMMKELKKKNPNIEQKWCYTTLSFNQNKPKISRQFNNDGSIEENFALKIYHKIGERFHGKIISDDKLERIYYFYTYNSKEMVQKIYPQYYDLVQIFESKIDKDILQNRIKKGLIEVFTNDEIKFFVTCTLNGKVDRYKFFPGHEKGGSYKTRKNLSEKDKVELKTMKPKYIWDITHLLIPSKFRGLEKYGKRMGINGIPRVFATTEMSFNNIVMGNFPTKGLPGDKFSRFKTIVKCDSNSKKLIMEYSLPTKNLEKLPWLLDYIISQSRKQVVNTKFDGYHSWRNQQDHKEYQDKKYGAEKSDAKKSGSNTEKLNAKKSRSSTKKSRSSTKKSGTKYEKFSIEGNRGSASGKNNNCLIDSINQLLNPKKNEKDRYTENEMVRNELIMKGLIENNGDYLTNDQKIIEGILIAFKKDPKQKIYFVKKDTELMDSETYNKGGMKSPLLIWNTDNYHFDPIISGSSDYSRIRDKEKKKFSKDEDDPPEEKSETDKFREKKKISDEGDPPEEKSETDKFMEKKKISDEGDPPEEKSEDSIENQIIFIKNYLKKFGQTHSFKSCIKTLKEEYYCVG